MKLRNNKGETLVEVLASIVVASLSVALLFSCITASTNVDRSAKELDDTYYTSLSAAENQTEAVNPTAVVKITKGTPNPSVTPDVTPKIVIYGEADTGVLYSYSMVTPAPEGTS